MPVRSFVEEAGVDGIFFFFLEVIPNWIASVTFIWRGAQSHRQQETLCLYSAESKRRGSINALRSVGARYVGFILLVTFSLFKRGYITRAVYYDFFFFFVRQFAWLVGLNGNKKNDIEWEEINGSMQVSFFISIANEPSERVCLCFLFPPIV